jgi:hypothetical protein
MPLIELTDEQLAGLRKSTQNEIDVVRFSDDIGTAARLGRLYALRDALGKSLTRITDAQWTQRRRIIFEGQPEYIVRLRKNLLDGTSLDISDWEDDVGRSVGFWRQCIHFPDTWHVFASDVNVGSDVDVKRDDESLTEYYKRMKDTQADNEKVEGTNQVGG